MKFLMNMEFLVNFNEISNDFFSEFNRPNNSKLDNKGIFGTYILVQVKHLMR